jgi:intron-binding protein aquarius
MVIEKQREGTSAWDTITSTGEGSGGLKFDQFFCRVLLLREERPLSPHERLSHVAFLVYAFQSLENNAVRASALRLVSLPLYCSVSPSRLDLELSRRPGLKRAWGRVRQEVADAEAGAGAGAGAHSAGGKRKRPAEDGKAGHASRVPADAAGVAALQRRLDAAALPALLSDFFETLESIPAPPGVMPAGAARYCEAFVSLVCDLLCQLPTRRFLSLLLADCHFVQRCRDSALAARAPDAPTIFSMALHAASRMDAVGARAAHLIDSTSAGARSSAGILGGSILADAGTTAAPVGRALGERTAGAGAVGEMEVDGEEESSGGGEGRLFRQLLDLLSFYAGFEVNEHSGAALTEAEAEGVFASRVGTLQRVAFKLFGKSVPQMREFALAATSVAAHPRTLRSYLGVLPGEALLGLARNLRLLPTAAPAGSPPPRVPLPPLTREFVTHVLLSAHAKRPSAVHAINALPLLPPDSLLWDAALVPAGQRGGEAGLLSPLALPKAGLQYLSPYDYLLRHFHLARLESAYGVRVDLVDAVRRMGGRLALGGERGGGPPSIASTTFTGWARMALPVDGFAVREVLPPKVGFSVPSAVNAEVRLSLARAQGGSRAEWDGLREHDVLFLVAIRPLVPVGRHPDELRDPAVLASFTAAAAAGPAALAALGSAAQSSKGAGRSGPRPLPDEEDFTFPVRYGVTAVRGCEVVEILDEAGEGWGEGGGGARDKGDAPRKSAPAGVRRTLRVRLDPAQFYMDQAAQAGGAGAAVLPGATPSPALYEGFNLLVRRDPRSNNFRAVLETVRDMMNDAAEGAPILPPWLSDIFLGYGDPQRAHYSSWPAEKQANDVDFRDTFLSAAHLVESFPGRAVEFRDEATGDVIPPGSAHPPFRLQFRPDGGVVALPCRPPPPGPFPEDVPRPNAVRFTPKQVEAVRSGLNEGLTLIVGPPGTGKTDTAVQIVTALYHARPRERILLVAHSNQALNDLFMKILGRDVPAHHLVRLGQGERELGVLTGGADFSKAGRMSAFLERRLAALAELERLGSALGAGGDVGYTCETAGYFAASHIAPRVNAFRADLGLPAPAPSDGDAQVAAAARIAYNAAVTAALASAQPASVAAAFPFGPFFASAPGGLEALFGGVDAVADAGAAEACFSHLSALFEEVASYRPLEILRTTRSRQDYTLVQSARIIACTVTHASIHRRRLVALGFGYDSVVMEEAGQVAEVESLVPLTAQAPGPPTTPGGAPTPRLKRVILIGDHNQLPPVVQNGTLAAYAGLDQSLFARLVRLGVPTVQLDLQGRARPTIAALYSWRYSKARGGAGLGDLSRVLSGPEYGTGTGGMADAVALVDVGEFEGRGESTPSPHFYQNLGEAEYVVAVFQYLRLAGWPAASIAMLTTYNGQKALLNDIVRKRCAPYPELFGVPAAVETVDKFQGQQADIVLLSLVRTGSVGHVRDVRRLVVALSRARLGLYVFARADVFAHVHELAPAFAVLTARPPKLRLLVGERQPTTRRADDEPAAWAKHASAGGPSPVTLIEVADVLQMGTIVHGLLAARQAAAQAGPAVAGAPQPEDTSDTSSDESEEEESARPGAEEK